ncbi:hypothetical protein NPIL_62271 [Nephila pilipes]|uniref:Uncharacterized protein n=1 Tax=Nephila pilipes TaxID=299642 RepID=A0A8X6QWK2_NEPPI|nr:hypothetical protein NPIL_62271 [Nephila pilipes]
MRKENGNSAKMLPMRRRTFNQLLTVPSQLCEPPTQAQKTKNNWRKRAVTSTPLQQPAQPPTLPVTEENFPQLTSRPWRTSTYKPIQNPIEMLKDPDVQELYNVQEKFVNIANNSR